MVMTRFGIIGGGLSGLSAAFHLLRASPGADVTLVEAAPRFGGWIRTQQCEDGSNFEFGPRSVRASDVSSPLMLRMCEELGLDSQVVPVLPSAPATKNRFLFVRGKLTRLTGSLLRPAGPFEKSLLPTALSLISKGHELAELQRREPMTIDAFFRRLCGAEVADVVLNPMMRGIYAGDAKQLGLREVFPRLVELQDKHGSLLRGMLRQQLSRRAPPLVQSGLHSRAVSERWFLWGLRGGMQTFTEAAAAHLTARGAKLVSNARCSSITFGAGGTFSCAIAGQADPLQFDRLLLALPAANCLQLLSTHPAFTELQRNLSSLRHADVAVVGLEFEGSLLPVEGFGHLIPSWEIPHVLGTTYDSCIFPTSASRTRIGTMFGGAWFESHCAGMEETDFVRLALECARAQLGISQIPKRTFFSLNRACIPQYGVGHFDRVAAVRAALKDSTHFVDLIGCSFDGVSVNDCVRSGWNAVQRLALNES